MRFAALLFAVVLVATAAFAVVPTTMSYQAVFTDTEGNVMPDGVYPIGFHIFPSAVGGPPIWSEWQDVTVANGVFEVILGSIFPLDPSDFLDPEGDGQWISISYEDTWMHPRQFISSVPYAFIACWADSARSSANVGSLSEQELIDNVSQVDNHETRIDALEAAEFGMFSQNANGGIVGTTPVAFPSFAFDVGGPASILFFGQVINDGMDHSAWKALLQLQDVGNGTIVSETEYEYRAEGVTDIHLQKTFPNGIGLGTYRIIVEVQAVDGEVDVDDIEFGAMWIPSTVTATRR